MDCISLISRHKVVPVIVIEELENTFALGEALMEGGLGIAEITFRTPCASQAIDVLSRRFPGMLVGAGTVLSIVQVKRAVDSGARFIVSPGLNREVVQYCLKNEVPVIPGAITPTEIQSAMELGLTVLKFFPAEAAGGLQYLKAVSAPFGQLKFIPTGGINRNNIESYLNYKSVMACGGSWMATGEMIAGKKFEEITRLTKEVVQSLAEPVFQS